MKVVTRHQPHPPGLAKSPTGIIGLDDITRGGIPRGRTTLVMGRCTICVVDVLVDPMQALSDGVVVTPTLVKRAPGPRRIIMGDLSRTPDVLAALELPVSQLSA
jgi:hypothetical protein